MITGIHGVDKGTITINGKNIMEEPMEAKKTFGYVPDSPDMFLRLKGIEYLNFMPICMKCRKKYDKNE